MNIKGGKSGGGGWKLTYYTIKPLKTMIRVLDLKNLSHYICPISISKLRKSNGQKLSLETPQRLLGKGSGS